MDIKVFSPEEFDKIEYAWKKLENGSDMTAFQLYDWYKNINPLYFKEKTKNFFREWIYVLAEENGEPFMIAPIQVVKIGFSCRGYGVKKAFYFIGRQGYTDYLNFIYKNFSTNAVKAIFQYLKDRYRSVKICKFEQLMVKTSLYEYLCTCGVVTNGFSDSKDCCMMLEVPDSFEEYKKRISKNLISNIRKSLNRQNRENVELCYEMIYSLDAKTSQVLLDIRSERLREKEKNALRNASFLGKVYNYSAYVIKKIFSAEHNVIIESCNPWCFVVRHGERIVGYFWGIKSEFNGEYYMILAGVDKEYERYTPVLSQFYLYIQELCDSEDNHIKVIDFTRGGERYKKEIGGTERYISTVEFLIY